VVDLGGPKAKPEEASHPHGLAVACTP